MSLKKITTLKRPNWAWRPEPIALAGGSIPETVCSNIYGGGKPNDKIFNKGILGFLSIYDLTNFAQVCKETSELVLMTDRVQKKIETYKDVISINIDSMRSDYEIICNKFASDKLEFEKFINRFHNTCWESDSDEEINCLKSPEDLEKDINDYRIRYSPLSDSFMMIRILIRIKFFKKLYKKFLRLDKEIYAYTNMCIPELPKQLVMRLLYYKDKVTTYKYDPFLTIVKQEIKDKEKLDEFDYEGINMNIITIEI
jgi:hypothetical protein